MAILTEEVLVKSIARVITSTPMTLISAATLANRCRSLATNNKLLIPCLAN